MKEQELRLLLTMDLYLLAGRRQTMDWIKERRIVSLKSDAKSDYAWKFRDFAFVRNKHDEYI